ncbi:N-acetylneuraminate synthase [Chrysiogenes arsenatis]|uniref:N-acetylneuraminate synthase n=1 Tax=Chrysiogenes arsenatis TaxID=309797 RepID=UPI0003F72B7F|nr:N-acetylneuraminate synthase [Chrysiogenes arsenatis]
MNSVFIIAEAGVNHNGSLGLAKQLIEIAAKAGADAVKFQTFQANTLVSKKAQKAEYQKQTTDAQESQYDMIKKLELTEAMHIELINHCKHHQIEFLSTPFDNNSIDLLNKLGMNTFKIPSGEITNLPYLRHIGELQKHIILSTGMADLGEVEDALDILVASGTPLENITVLHATTEYPCPIQEVNLRAMQTIKQAFGVKVGYSDHTQGIEIPIAAVAMGATIIEKHFTLDRNMEGPDHKASLEPAELQAMVDAIRNIEKALGDGKKKPTSSEAKNKPVARKSLVAAKTIKVGEILNSDNVCIKRPGNGINPMRWDEVMGTKAIKNYNEDDLI